MLRALEEVARRVGLEVRVEETWKGGPSAGGVCKLRGVPLVLMDGLAPLGDRIAVLCDALARVDLDEVFLPPALRALIQSNAGRGSR